MRSSIKARFRVIFSTQALASVPGRYCPAQSHTRRKVFCITSSASSRTRRMDSARPYTGAFSRSYRHAKAALSPAETAAIQPSKSCLSPCVSSTSAASLPYYQYNAASPSIVGCEAKLFSTRGPQLMG